MKTIQLAFEVVGSVHQQVKILDKKITEEILIKGLKDGIYATTTWINENQKSTIEEVKTGKIIAEIVTQEIEGEYSDFR